MNKTSLTLIGVSLILLVSACSSVTSVPAGTPTLTLNKPEGRVTKYGVTVVFPAGDYLPDSATPDGVYYIAPRGILFRVGSVGDLFRGGVFIPSPTAKDQRQHVWSYGRGGDVATLTTRASNLIHSYPITKPVVFITVRSNQTSEPMPMSVTPAAGAPAAPATGMAHL